MEELLSVIIPVYNGEKFLRSTLKSVLKQSYRNIEILLINDGSTDSTEKIAKEFQKQDDRLMIFNLKNGGVSKARNFGLDHMHGEYVAFLDSDDLVHEDCYSVMMNEMRGGYDAVAVDFEKFESTATVKSETNIQCDKVVYTGKEEFLLSLCIEDKRSSVHGYVWNKIYRSSKIKNLRFNEEIQMCEDSLFSIQFFEQAECICVIKEPMYFYRVYSESSTRNSDVHKKATALSAYRYLVEMSRGLNETIYNHFVHEYIQWNMIVCDSLCYPQNRDIYERVHNSLLEFADHTQLSNFNLYNRIKVVSAKHNYFIFYAVKCVLDEYSKIKRVIKRQEYYRNGVHIKNENV